MWWQCRYITFVVQMAFAHRPCHIWFLQEIQSPFKIALYTVVPLPWISWERRIRIPYSWQIVGNRYLVWIFFQISSSRRMYQWIIIHGLAYIAASYRLCHICVIGSDHTFDYCLGKWCQVLALQLWNIFTIPLTDLQRQLIFTCQRVLH